MHQSFGGDPLSELPLGLAMKLAQHPGAMDEFTKLPPQQKTEMVSKIQSAKSGDEARGLIERAMAQLGNGYYT
jgi:uncharacterized protein YdeI (YjbR/CyaY-like superfamily)